MTTRPPAGSGIYAELDGTFAAPRHARALIRHALGRHPAADDAVLIASELVTNAVAHSRSGRPGGTLLLAVETTADQADVRVQVRDAGSTGTPGTPAAPDGEHGRGLAIVAAIASLWGSQPTATGGRTTWAQISRRQSAATESRAPEREPG